MTVSERTTRIVAIDGLRGLFAAIVIAFHYQLWFELGLPEAWVSILDRGAIYAVCGFFVISGASMAIAYRQAPPANTRSMAAFYTKRFFRIAPLYYLVLSVHLAGRAVNCLGGDGCAIDPALLFANLTFVFGFGKAALNSEVVAGWSIGIEWIFYFAFPVLFLLAMRSWRWVAALAVISVGVLIVWDIWYLTASQPYWPTYAQFPAYFFYFVAGIAIGLFATPGNLSRWSGIALPLFIIGISVYIALELASGHSYDNRVDVAGPTAWLFAALTCMIVAGSTFINVTKQWLISACKLAGALSYGVYLLHFPVSMGVVVFGLTGTSAALAGAACTLVLAAVIYRYFEKPMIRLGARIASRTPEVEPVTAR